MVEVDDNAAATTSKRKLIKLEYTDDQIRATGVDPEGDIRNGVVV